ncbi:PNC1 [Symbiodinium pilosum]|uniref:PNC1 protein n=1 Tax=Symbiodinium pilosum TaxID=2952 RepID=A0A812PEW8_SYMPI|nr:PNC1 [Symbiodinium pilosum]
MPAKNDIQNCGNHLKPVDDADMPGTKPYVEKYYTGPESNPTGYPLPAVSEYEDSNHAPPVDVKECVATCCTKPPAAANNARGLDKRPQVRTCPDDVMHLLILRNSDG